MTAKSDFPIIPLLARSRGEEVNDKEDEEEVVVVEIIIAKNVENSTLQKFSKSASIPL